jgi:thiol:disulfide interchange protein DsbC|tara:strand:+ start:55 stop:768 length:714 start_codon:yes stop_codon:yes gene_type:complete
MKKTIFVFLFIISCSQIENDSSQLIEEQLSKVIPIELNIDSIKESQLPNFYEVILSDGSFFYVEKGGQYLVLGDIFKIKNEELVNLSREKNYSKAKDMLQKIDEKSLIKFSPKEIKYKVYVFTDVDCGFCRKFHNQISSYLDQGIQVNYLAFPRSGIDSDTYKKMSIAWCSLNRQEVLTGLKKDKDFEQIDCEDNPIKTHFELAKSIDIQGTPTIISQSGFTIPGYIEAKELLEYLK